MRCNCGHPFFPKPPFLKCPGAVPMAQSVARNASPTFDLRITAPTPVPRQRCPCSPDYTCCNPRNTTGKSPYLAFRKP